MKKLLLFFSGLLFCFMINAQEPDQNEPVIQGNEDQHEGNEDRRDGEAEDRENIDGALDDLQNYHNTLNDIRDAYNGMRNFSPGECAPDFSTGGAAMMPSTCNGNSACGQCFERAAGELSFIRRQLARLSCIYNNTKNFTNSAIAFGDNVSGIHAVTGLAWQNARGEIVASFDHFKGTYDRKYVDMINALQRALMGIDACERQYGLTDWYQRFGFIYFEFMKDKYKRAD